MSAGPGRPFANRFAFRLKRLVVAQAVPSFERKSMKNFNTSLWYSPNEDAFSIKATEGCSWNKCVFCALYRDKEYRIVPLKEIERILGKVPVDDIPGITSVFIGEGNALSAGPVYLMKLLGLIKKTFSDVKRIGINATVSDVMKKRPKTLRELRDAGLTAIYVGVDSGDRKSLRSLKKGSDPETTIKAGRRIMDSGITLRVNVLLGAGGRQNKKSHIEGTAAILKEINPHVISVSTLSLMSGAPLFAMVKKGEYTHPTPIESVIEMRRLIDSLDLKGTFIHSGHHTNMVHIAGHLPEKKKELVCTLDRFLNNPTDELLTTEYFQKGS